MKQTWQPEELVEHWTLLGDELVLLEGKNTPSRLVFALLLKFFQLYARFPEQKAEIPQSVIDYVASQLRVGSESYASFDWQGRTLKRHRVEIRQELGFRTFQVKDGKALTAWLQTQLLAYELKIESLKLAAKQHLRALKIEPPTPERLERLVRSAIRSFEEEFCQNIASQLSLPICQRLDALLTASRDEPIEGDNQTVVTASLLAQLKTDPGRLGLDSLQKEAAKLEQLRQLELPEQLFGQVGVKVLETYKQRVAVEAPSQLRRHPDHKRYTLLAAFCGLRSREITDNLVELLIQIVHRIGARAQRRVEKELLNDFKKVSGKTGLLFQLAEAALDKPEGVVKEVIYPIVGEQTLKNLVREFKSTGTAYREKVYTVMRSSYSNHYRRIAPILLSLLEFRSNNDIHRPVIEALELLKKYKDSKQRCAFSLHSPTSVEKCHC